MLKKLFTFSAVVLLTLPVMLYSADLQFLISRSDIESVKSRVLSGDKSFQAVLGQLCKDAETAMHVGPFSVTFDKVVPPSGDRHDYVSMAKYWWPDPENPQGPYIRRDGETNPVSNSGDKAQRKGLYQAVETLATAFFFFDEQKYADKAAEFVRIWFIDDATRMNPNMQYGQYVPGRNEGRPFGIIETRPFIRILDAVQLMQHSDSWTERDHKNLQKWFSEYLDWLLSSDWGQKESSNGNNHETACNLQILSYALFTDRQDIAFSVLERFKEQIIYQIEPDGRMPREIDRTKSLHYSSMNLSLMLHIADIAASQNVDLFTFETDDGRSIKKAFSFLFSYFENPKKWPYQQIEKSNADYDELFYILRRAQKFDSTCDSEHVLKKRYAKLYATHRGQLYWPAVQNGELSGL